MAKDKKKAYLEERIAILQSSTVTALTKKTSSSKEVDITSIHRQLAKLKAELAAMK